MKTIVNEFSFNLGEWLKKLFASLSLSLVQVICCVIFFLEQVFWTLARGIKQNDGTYKTIFDYLIFNNGDLSSLKSNSLITNIIVYMMIIGVFLTILAMIIALIKYQLSIKDEDQNPKIVIMGVIKAILLIIAFPFCIVLMLKISNALVDSICTYANIDTGTSYNSIANKIYFMFGNVDKSLFYVDNTPRFSFINRLEDFQEINPECDTLYSFKALKDIGFLSNDGIDGYQYFLAIIVGIILAYALFKCLLILGKRIFDMTVLYVVAPLTISTYPADDGKRYGVWKDLMIAKIMSAFGLSIGFIIYMIFLEEISKLFMSLNPTYYGNILGALGDFIGGTNKASALSGLTLTATYLIIIISGASGLPTIYQMIATLVSETAGHQASSDLANMNSNLNVLSRGAHHLAHDAVRFGKTSGKFALGTAKVAGKMFYNPQGVKKMQGNDGIITGNKSKMVLKGGFMAPAINAIKRNNKDNKEDKLEAMKQNILENYNDKDIKGNIKKYEKMTGQRLTAKDAFNYAQEKEAIKNFAKQNKNLDFTNDVHKSEVFKEALDKNKDDLLTTKMGNVIKESKKNKRSK